MPVASLCPAYCLGMIDDVTDCGGDRMLVDHAVSVDHVNSYGFAVDHIDCFNVVADHVSGVGVVVNQVMKLRACHDY